jgi:threonine aldolase
MTNIRIDLFSDTVTRPTPEMRRAICDAEVGDEQRGEDPSVNRLVDIVCNLLGMQDALFLPSGTMCNQVAFRVYCRPGDEIIMDRSAHTRHYETGGPAALTGATMYPLDGTRGVFSADQLVEAIRPSAFHAPRSRVVVIEQTSNLGGGSVWPLETMRDVCVAAEKYGLARHMDGARLLNAVVATGITACEYAASFDSVWIDFSKSLGAPVGAAIAGSQGFIQEARRWKQQFGGAMRQAGIIAAAAVYALNHHVDRLAIDHANARVLADGLAEIDGITVEPVETNMIFFDVSGLDVTAEEFNRHLANRGVRVSVIGTARARALTHLDVSRAQVEEAVQIIRDVAADLRR